MRTIIAPITLLYNGQYVPPGTPVDLPEDEAASIVARFGEVDPSEVLTKSDLQSIQLINQFHALENK